MAKARILIPSKFEALENGMAGRMPELSIYHVTSRVVHRQLLFSPDAKEEFRKFMRMYERFSGCRVRYFKDGAVLGSRSFVDGIFALRRKQFGTKRTSGARIPRGCAQ
ncbi:MAG: hypothetical protein QNL77_08245 [Akkermansiaceae bacterium]